VKALNILKYVFTVIGAGMLFGAYALYSSTSSFVDRAVETEGVVVDLILSRSSDSRAYYPVVVFQDSNGREVEFQSNSGSNPASYSRGERISVLYETSAPESARINGFFSLWGGAIIVGGLGLVFGLIGSGMILVGVVKGRSKSRLQKNGVEVPASFQSVERNTGLVVNGRSPFQVVCQWQHPQTGEVHIFRSDNIWFDPTDYIKHDTLPVLVDESNLKKYWVDTSFLPKMAG